MANKIILLFSHILTESQISELKNHFNIETITYLPDYLQNIWSNIPPDYIDIEKELTSIKEFVTQNLYNNGKNYILVQGEYGAVYHMVNFAFENNCIPIYSASKRAYESKKIDEDKIENIHYFKHIKFQLYKESNRKWIRRDNRYGFENTFSAWNFRL